MVVDKAEDVERISHNLHSVLYTYIIKEDLGKCVDFVDSLIVQGNVSSSILDHQLPTSGAGVEKPPLMTIVYNSMRMEVDCPCYLLHFCNAALTMLTLVSLFHPTPFVQIIPWDIPRYA